MLDLATLRERHGIMARDMVVVVQRRYPRYNKQLQSQVEHGDLCGIMLRPDAETAICTAYDLDPQNKPRKPERRALGHRLTLRVTESEFEQLQLLKTAKDCDSIQELWHKKILPCYFSRNREVLNRYEAGKEDNDGRTNDGRTEELE